MKDHNKVLIALGAIALGSAAAPNKAAAQDADGEYQKTCDWLAQQSTEYLKQYIKFYRNDPCVEVAASLLAERTQSEAGLNPAPASNRY